MKNGIPGPDCQVRGFFVHYACKGGVVLQKWNDQEGGVCQCSGSREGSPKLPPPRDCDRDERRKNATVTLSMMGRCGK